MLLPGALALFLFHPEWQGQDRLCLQQSPALGQSLVLGPLLLIKVIVGIPVESSSEESASVQSWFPLPSCSLCAVSLECSQLWILLLPWLWVELEWLFGKQN